MALSCISRFEGDWFGIASEQCSRTSNSLPHSIPNSPLSNSEFSIKENRYNTVNCDRGKTSVDPAQDAVAQIEIESCPYLSDYSKIQLDRFLRRDA